MITRENIVVEENKKVRLVQAYLNQPIICLLVFFIQYQLN